MTATQWITDIALVLIVFRQLREGRLGPRSYLLPLGIISFVAYRYLDTIPTGGNDLKLIGVLVGVGALLGVAGGVFTRLRVVGDHVLIKAGLISAVLWVIGMGARIGFQQWVEHGGADDVARFSVDHHITGEQAWLAALLLMALTEVVSRLATIFVRSRMLPRPGGFGASVRPGAATTRVN
ncbi:hypothetical protein EES43_29630 [Streptomyces sp. ADI96-02]|uniref:hypothetical protein n=1 Tax=Streptomyces sp. ADI96-02 TaxID=1522760 RepID=UPI000F5512B9|nr:hypothetical protein [Streptomyces sp. ADI96-02]RPK54141.1 hypothetical protein EES43_29630 [Streptomyces sp. ADI96-02]